MPDLHSEQRPESQRAVEVERKVVQALPLERPQRTAVEAEQKLTQLPHQPRQAAEAAQDISLLSQLRLEAEAAVNSAVCTINRF